MYIYGVQGDDLVYIMITTINLINTSITSQS